MPDHRTRLARLLLTAVLASGQVGAASGQQSPAPERLMGQALHLEEVEGCRAAIPLYRQVAAPGNADRALAARAALRLAHCLEATSPVEARRLYEELVRKSPDKAVVTTATARLALLAPGISNATPNPPSAPREAWPGEDLDIFTTWPSPDRTKLAIVEWRAESRTEDLVVRDVNSGIERVLAKGTPSANGQSPVDVLWRPDGRAMACLWRAGLGIFDIRMVGLEDGSAPRVVYADRADPPDPRRGLGSWTPDGRQLLFTRSLPDHLELGLLDVGTGQVRWIHTSETCPARARVSPDGRFIAFDYRYPDNEADSDISIVRLDGTAETRIVMHTASDELVGWTPSGDGVLFMSDRSGATALWLLPVRNGKASGPPALLQDNLGRVDDWRLGPDGTLIYQVDHGFRDVVVAAVDWATGRVIDSPEPVARYGAGYNSTPAWSPDGGELAFFTQPNVRRRVWDTVTVWNQADRRQRSTTTGLRLSYVYNPRWLDGRTLAVRGADATGRDGVYAVNLTTGTATLLADANSTGATPASLVGRTVYHTIFKAGKVLGLGAFDLDTGEDREVLPPVAGAVARMIFASPDARRLAYLDSDRAGRVWVVGLPAGPPRLIFTPPGSWHTSSCAWHPSGEGLWCSIFQVVDGARHEQLWAVPLSGEPRRTDLQSDFATLAAHPDGKHLAYTWSSPQKTEILILDHLLPASSAKPARR